MFSNYLHNIMSLVVSHDDTILMVVWNGIPIW